MKRHCSEYIFVYGTLKRGFRIKETRAFHKQADFIDRGQINGRLLTNGNYPAAQPASGRFKIKGELFKPRNMAKCTKFLDGYENAYDGKNEYKRVTLQVRLNNGGLKTAQVYIYNQSTQNLKLLVKGSFHVFKSIKI